MERQQAGAALTFPSSFLLHSFWTMERLLWGKKKKKKGVDWYIQMSQHRCKVDGLTSAVHSCF